MFLHVFVLVILGRRGSLLLLVMFFVMLECGSLIVLKKNKKIYGRW